MILCGISVGTCWNCYGWQLHHWQIEILKPCKQWIFIIGNDQMLFRPLYRVRSLLQRSQLWSVSFMRESEFEVGKAKDISNYLNDWQIIYKLLLGHHHSAKWCQKEKKLEHHPDYLWSELSLEKRYWFTTFLPSSIMNWIPISAKARDGRQQLKKPPVLSSYHILHRGPKKEFGGIMVQKKKCY